MFRTVFRYTLMLCLTLHLGLLAQIHEEHVDEGIRIYRSEFPILSIENISENYVELVGHGLCLDPAQSWQFNDAEVYELTVRSENFGTIVLTFLDRNANDLQTQIFVAKDYTRSPYVTEEAWKNVAPYLIPYDHPARVNLDRIFYSSRVSLSETSLRNAGFKIIAMGRGRHVFVLRHASLSGYLIKLYTDDMENVTDHDNFQRRVKGAMVTREVIDRLDQGHLFAVPQKWIYPLPVNPSPPDKSKYIRKNFVLLVEDMDILDSVSNYAKWESSAVTKETLDCVYLLLDEAGLWDSAFAFNMPFCKNGMIAIIDTEYYLKWPVRFKTLLRYLSPEMEKYWKSLMHHDGPKRAS